MNKRFGLGLAMVGMIVVGAATTQTLSAQQQAIKRTVLQQAELTDIEGRDGVMIQGEIPPGAESGRHVHPGTELGYLLEGALVREVVGDSPAKTLVVYIVEQGKPPGFTHQIASVAEPAWQGRAMVRQRRLL